MKRQVSTGYTFTPSTSHVDLAGVAGFTFGGLLGILNVTTGGIVYLLGTAGFGATISGTVLTLQASLAGMASGDTLAIIYDDGVVAAQDASIQSVITALAGLIKVELEHGGAILSPTNRLPVEIDADTVTLTLPAGLAQDASLQTLIGDVASNHSDLTVLHTDVGTTLHADLAAVLAKLVAAPALDSSLQTLITQGQDTSSVAVTDANIGGPTDAAPSTDTGSATLNGRLQRLAQRLSSILATLQGSLTVALPVGASTDATLQSILSAIQAQRSETLWTDDTKAYFVRTLKNGAETWTDVSGNTVSAPGTGARPAAGGAANVDTSKYRAVTAGTGYSVMDLIDHVVTTDPSTGAVIGHYWLNTTTEAVLSSAPTAANIEPLPSLLPDNAATASLQSQILAALQAALPAGTASIGKVGLQVGGADVTATNQVPVTVLDYAPVAGATVGLTAGPAATSPSVALPANVATCYRVRNPTASASPIAWRLSTSSSAAPTLPTPYATNGVGGSVGDKMIDPGGVEIIGLTAAQQAALAAGTLYLSAITPAGGSGVLYITPGTGA